MIKIAVCDDNDKILNKIAKIIKIAFAKENVESEVSVYNTGRELLKEHSTRKFDVIFLDIDMPEVSGFDVAKQLRERFDRCQIVFVTSYSEFVFQSFDFQPFHFIQKNSRTIIGDVEQVVHKLLRFLKQDKSLCLKDENERKVLVPIRDIVYIKSSGHYVYYSVQGNDKFYRSRHTIRECADILESFDFVQTHRQYLVNLRYLEYIDNSKNEVKMSNMSMRLVMSRNFKKNVQEKYLEYLRSQI